MGKFRFCIVVPAASGEGSAISAALHLRACDSRKEAVSARFLAVPARFDEAG